MLQQALSPIAQQVWQAIHTLYRNSPAEQQAASKWLNEFAEHDEAPHVSLELLLAEHPTEVQFFSANMLLTAVKRRWTKMDANLQQLIHHKLGHELGRRAGEQGTLSWMAQQRLILACASIAASSGPAALASTVSRGVELAKQGLSQVSVELLSAVAEAVHDLQRRRRDAALEVLQPLSAAAFSVVLHNLRDSSGKPGPRLAALRCLQAWLQLGNAEGEEALMSLPDFRSSQNEVYEALLEHLGHPDEDVAAAATQAVVFLINVCEVSGVSEAEEAVIREVASAVVRLCSVPSPEEHLLFNAAQIAAGLAARDCTAVALHIPEAISLAAVALQALACGHMGAAEAAIEYFDTLNAVPLAQRHPSLQQPVYASMLPHLARLAAYPADFTSWEESTDEGCDSFHSFRDNVLGDALDTCQKLLQQQYLDFFAAALQEATTWQAAETALFALKLYRRKSGISYDPSAQTEEDGKILALFTYVTSARGHLGTHPCCMDAAAQLLSVNSSWLATAPQPVFQAAIGYALACLRLRECAAAGASAFEFLCRATPAASAPALLEALLPALLPLLESTDPDGPSWEDRAEAVKGLVDLAAAHSSKDAQAAAATAAAAQRFLSPLANKAATLATQPHSDAWEAAVAGLLQLLSAALQRLEFLSLAFSTEGETTPASSLAAACFPSLERLSQHEAVARSPTIAVALAQALRRCLEAFGAAGGGALDRVLQALGRIFTAEPRTCLDALAAAAESSREWPAAAAGLAAAVCQVGAAMLPHLQGESADPELAAAWFKLLARSLDGEAPVLVDPASGDDVAAAHFPLAIHLLKAREEPLVRALLTFLRAAAGVDRPDATNRGRSCMHAHGEAAMTHLLRAVVATCPQLLLPPLARLLHALLNHALFAAASRQWFTQAMSSDEIIGAALNEEERRAVCSTALGLQPALAGLFLSVIKDMAAVARREVDPEVLLSYEV